MFGRRFKTKTDTILGLIYEILITLILFLGVVIMIQIVMQLGLPG